MKQPASANGRTSVAPGTEERLVVTPAATSQEGATERAWAADLGRIADLLAQLSTLTQAFAKNLELDLAERERPSLMLDMAPAVSEPPKSELLTCAQLAALLQIHERTLRRMVRAGKIPEPIKLGDREIRWRTTTIESWLAEREENSR